MKCVLIAICGGLCTAALWGQGGTVTSITAGSGLLGGTITTSGTLSLNLANANTWNGAQSFGANATFAANAGFPGGIWNSSGNVGIGTTNPTATLNVVNGSIALDNNGNYDTLILRTGQNNSARDYSANMILATGGCTVSSPCEMNTSYGNYFGMVSFRSTMNQSTSLGGMLASIPQNHTSSSRPMSLDFLTTPVGSTSPNTVLHLDSSGNVGIGTFSPAQKLDVSGNINAGGASWTGYYANANSATATLRISDPVSYGQVIGFAGTDTNTPFAIRSNANISAWFATNGNVGIGTISPQHLLHVAGTIGAEELIVSSTGADYVFDPGYRLAPLSEVDRYIKENGHLPDIPSADEVKEKGLGVGEMQAKLLAKIEELTLHMIQSDKENQELREENRQIRRSLERLEERR